MIEENIDEDVFYLVYQLVEQIDAENEYIHQCDDCSIIDSSVKRQSRSERGRTTTDSNIILYLCDNCSEKRHNDAQKVLEDLESLAHEVEQRLQAIENTEKELDQWRDTQLQKNRDFWDGNIMHFPFNLTIRSFKMRNLPILELFRFIPRKKTGEYRGFYWYSRNA
jgi:hypothetical protein